MEWLKDLWVDARDRWFVQAITGLLTLAVIVGLIVLAILWSNASTPASGYDPWADAPSCGAAYGC